jgi:hypothetical protein
MGVCVENIHVISNSGHWSVRRTGSSRAFRTFPTQKEAIECGWDIAHRAHGALVVHSKDGTVLRRKDFGGMKSKG